MSAGIGVTLEETNAMSDARFYLNERGKEVTLFQNDESDVVRDKYGGIIKREGTGLILHAHPIIFSPNQRQLDKAGIRETVDVIVTLAMLDLIDNSIDYKSFDQIRWEVFLEDETFVIKSKNRINRFSHQHLNIVLGLVKK